MPWESNTRAYAATRLTYSSLLASTHTHQATRRVTERIASLRSARSAARHDASQSDAFEPRKGLDRTCGACFVESCVRRSFVATRAVAAQRLCGRCSQSNRNGRDGGDSALASFAVAEVASRAWARTWSRASRNRLECFPRISAESKPRAIRGRTKVVTEPSSRNFSGTFRSCSKCYGHAGGRNALSRTTLRSFWRPDLCADEGRAAMPWFEPRPRNPTTT